MVIRPRGVSNFHGENHAEAKNTQRDAEAVQDYGQRESQTPQSQPRAHSGEKNRRPETPPAW